MTAHFNRDAYREYFEKEFTWLSGFLNNVRRYSSKIALIDPVLQKKWSYSELNTEAELLAGGFYSISKNKYDLVMIQMLNSEPFVACYIAAKKADLIPAPVNPRISASETAQILDTNKPVIYVYDAEISDTVTEALSMSEHKPSLIISVDYLNQKPVLPEDHIFYDTYLSQLKPCKELPEPSSTTFDESLRLQTSGTTGVSKSVPLTNINEILSAHNLIMDLKMDETSVTMNLTPWFHRGGIHSTGPATSLYLGCTHVIMHHFSPNDALSHIEKYHVTHLTAVPSIFLLLSEILARKDAHPLGLEALLSMGSPLEREACIYIQKYLCKNIYNGYGTTESLWNLVLKPYVLPDRAGYTGKANMDDDVRVVKLFNDRKAKPDELAATDYSEIGEIIIKSPAKTAGCYIDEKELTTDKYSDGWLYTGDLGVWDSDHYIKLISRKDDMIISLGENIYPAAIEEILNTHPFVSDSLVTSVPHEKKGELIVAYIVPSSPELTITALIKYCAQNADLPAFKRPRLYRLVDDLPRTATGKKQHYIARKQAVEDYKKGLFTRK